MNKGNKVIAYLLVFSLTTLQMIQVTGKTVYANGEDIGRLVEKQMDDSKRKEIVESSKEGQKKDDPIVEPSEEGQKKDDPIVEPSEEGQKKDNPIVEPSEEGQKKDNPIVEPSEEGQKKDDPIVEPSEEEQKKDDPIVEPSKEEQKQKDFGEGEKKEDTKENLNKEKEKNGLNLLKNVSLEFAEDLQISVSQDISVSTPSKNGLYNGAMDEYYPGVDGLENDQVTNGQYVTYGIRSSFNSKNHETYSFDDIRFELVDDDGNTISKDAVPIYFINQNQDSEDTVDDNQYEIASQSATATMINWTDADKETFQTGGTVNMGITFDLGNETRWKTKLAPKIRIICSKDGEEVKSDIVKLPEIKLSAKADYNTVINDLQSFVYKDHTLNSSFMIRSNKNPTKAEDSKETNFLQDNPLFEKLTYKIKIKAEIDKKDITKELTSGNFLAAIQKSASGTTAELQYDGENGILSVTLINQIPLSENQIYDTKISVILPYEGEEAYCSLKFSASLDSYSDEADKSGIIFEGFKNKSLFRIGGKENKSYEIGKTEKIKTENESKDKTIPLVSDTISTDKKSGAISHQVTLKNPESSILDFTDFQIYEFLEHEIFCFENNGGLVITLEDKQTIAIPSNCYTVTYAKLPMPKGYEEKKDLLNQQNTLDIVKKYVASNELTDYANVSEANLKTFTLNDEFTKWIESEEIDLSATFTITVTDSSYKRMSDETIEKLPQEDTLVRQRGRIVSMLSIAIADGQETNADALVSSETMSAIEKANGKSYLCTGGSQYGSNFAIERFGSISTPKANVSYDIKSDGYELSFLHDGNKITKIDQYMDNYVLKLGRKSGWHSAETVLKAGTKVTINVPESILKYRKNAEQTPYIITEQGTVEITELEYKKDSIVVILPEEVNMAVQDAGIYIPMLFQHPTAEVSLKASECGIEISEGAYLSVKGDVLDGVSYNPLFFNISFTGTDVTLLYGDPDSNGHSVEKTETNNIFQFTGRVFNTTSADYDFYMALAVPVKGYNAAANENDLKGYITKITSAENVDRIYYLREQDLTEQDIAMMSSLSTDSTKEDETIDLKEFYKGIQGENSKWILYDANTALPSDVVMLIGYANNLKTQKIAKIVYQVNMDLSNAEAGTYKNYSQIKYYSGNSRMEAASNKVEIVTTKIKGESTDPSDSGNSSETFVPSNPTTPDNKVEVPTEIPNTEIDDEDIPLTDGSDLIDDEETPAADNMENEDIPDLENNETIEEEDVPLSDGKELTEDEDTKRTGKKTIENKDQVQLKEELVPLESLPQTGDSTKNAGALALVTAMGMVVAWLRRKKLDS